MKHILFFLIALITSTVSAQYKNTSIGFTENKGQITDQKGKPNPAVHYLLNTNGLNVQIKKNGFSYDIYETKKHPLTEIQKAKRSPSSLLSKDKKDTPDYSLEYIYHRVDIDFVNSNPKVVLISEKKSTDYDNYYNVPNKPEGVLMVHKFKQITYKNIYPNIDVVFTIPKDSLKPVEYNFVVHPKGKISDIQLKFSGAETNLVDNKIQMQVQFGKMEETLPMSWTEDGKCKKEITVGYKKIKNNVYGFESDSPVTGKTVVIDPVPTRLWGTFYGDEENNGNITFGSIATDFLGNNYLTGITSTSNSSYATSGAHQSTIGNPTSITFDGIIVKFTADGNKMWGTYYGGEGPDFIYAIKTDTQNNVIIAGETHSKTNICTIGTYNTSYGGYVNDAFLVKFNGSGIRLWGEYYGGNYNDTAYDIDVDKNNNIFMVGSYSIDRTNNIGNTPLGDGFITKFAPEGNILWNKLYGGKKTDKFTTVKVGENFIVTGGFSDSTDNISTPGVFQENFQNYNDAIVFKLNLNGDRIWSTYYGGESTDMIYAIEMDDDQNVYIGGESLSATNITTPNSFDDYNMYTETGFFAKLDQNGQRIWGSYLGSSTKIYSLVFKNNSLYIGGNGGTDRSITSLCAYKRSGIAGGYIGKFSKMGEFIWGSYIGGFDQYSKTKITIKNNEIVVGGTSNGTNDGIADQNSYQPNILGRKNFYLMKFSEDPKSTISVSPSSNSPVCTGNKLTFNVDAGYNYLWSGPNGFSSTLQNPIIDNTTNANSGIYNLIVSNVCDLQKSYDINVIIGDIEKPIPNLTTLPTITGDCQTQITTTPTATDACAGAIMATTTSPLSYDLPGTYTIVWNYDDGNGNSVTQNQTVIISAQSLPTATSPQSFCIQQNATLSDITITGQNIKWYDALTNGNLLVITSSLQNGLTYYASQTINGCESERVPVLINIQNTPAPTANNSQSFCSTQNATLNNIAITGTSINWYSATVNGSLLPSSTSLQDGITYYATQTINGCESINRMPVAVSLINTLNATNYAETICDDQNNGTEMVNLSNFNSKLIGSTSETFSYYTSANAAENQVLVNQISNYSNYNLTIGQHTFYVRIDSPNTCHQIVELQLTLVSKPIINIPNIVPICENNTITIDAGAGFDTYLWSNGATTQTISVSNPGNFSVTVTDNHDTISCSSTENFTVKKSNIATITSIETKDWTDNENIITVYATGAGDFEYSIDGVNFQNSNQFLNVHSGEYTVSVRDKNGCGTATDEVYLLMYPKFFTPNGDGYNDTWKIKFSEIEENLTVKIFDHYGKLIKTLANNSGEWNGTINGAELPATDYWFVVTRANGKEYKGHFSLKR